MPLGINSIWFEILNSEKDYLTKIYSQVGIANLTKREIDKI